MPTLSENLALGRCPHCSVADPNLRRVHYLDTNSHTGNRPRKWSVYLCGSCGGLVTAWAPDHNEEIQGHYPSIRQVSDDIPERPRTYLQQAYESRHAPVGAAMLAASAVDAMLTLKGYGTGTPLERMEKAAADRAITADMVQWAQAVRLDANDPRHAEPGASLPTREEARRVIDFANALAEILFVLPSRVQRGLRGNAK